ncbi:MAG: RDD family protein [Balneolaceae bacterium]
MDSQSNAHTIGVETARHIQLRYRPATVLQRIGAWFIDGLLFAAYITILLWLSASITPLSDFLFADDRWWILLLAIFLPYFLYFPVIETVWNGYTVGKKTVGIRVVKTDGSRASFGSYVVRWMLRLFEITLTGGVVAVIAILMNGKGQRLGDLIADTAVVRVREGTDRGKQAMKRHARNRAVQFESAGMLTDQDIAALKKILNARGTYSNEAWLKQAQKARRFIEEKTGISAPDMQTFPFLKTVLYDYYTIHSQESAEKVSSPSL